MHEIAARVITGAVFKFYIWAIDLHAQAAEFPILRGSAAGETEDVIRRAIFLHLRKNAGEIVGIKERFATSIGSERCQGVLRRGVRAEIVDDRCSGIRGNAVQACGLSFTARWQ